MSALKGFFYESLTVILPVPLKSVRYYKVSAITRCPLYSKSAIDRFDCTLSLANESLCGK